MPLHIDSRGLALTASLPSTPAMFDEAVNAYLGMRKDTLLRAAALTESDSACVLAHCFNGYLQMHACQSEGARRAQQSLDRAKEIARRSRVMPREEFHIAALNRGGRGISSARYTHGKQYWPSFPSICWPCAWRSL